ncbi:MAG TPA: TerC family protein, partial [Burkholderiaceae bacterium]|nr:TerC family protein [Burkholderiaceae bacterium]
LVMSVDNVIAIAGAAQQADPDHQMGLVIFGLIVSIPLIVWGSTLVLRLLERYPLVITLGGALLGWIAGGMMITDIVTVDAIGEPSAGLRYAAAIAGAVLVVVLGKVLGARRKPAVRSD